MKWLKERNHQAQIVNPDLVKVKPKPTLAVMEPDAVVKKKRAKKRLLIPKDEIKTKKHGIHEGSIPTGALCYLRNRAKEMFGFDYCTVLKTHVSRSSTMAWADVLTPEGNIVTIDLMWLRNTHVENGNIDEGDE